MTDKGVIIIKVTSLGGEKALLNIDGKEEFRELVKESNHLFSIWVNMVRA